MVRIRSFLLLLALATLTACASRVDQTPYPVDRTLEQGTEIRRDFVDSFLQGKWCEAEALYRASIENAVRRDDFCEAARTARLLARLRAYVGQDAPHAAQAAQEYLRAAITCPQYDELPKQDKAYAALLEAGDYPGLARALGTERDSLYASVYARKGARQAMQEGRNSDALALVETARAVDARQGWVTFLREDWSLRHELEDDQQTRQAIRERIEIIEQRIEPCP